MKKIMKASSASIASAIVTSACCIPALIVLVFSLSSVTLGATLARYHWWFLGAGTGLLGYSYFLFFREKRACSSSGCTPSHRGFTIASLAVSTAVILAFATNSVLPLLTRGSHLSAPPVLEGVSGQASAVIQVSGMTCFSCELHVQKVLGEVRGVREVKASAAQGAVTIRYDPATATIGEMVEAINSKTGYKATAPSSAPGRSL